MDALRKSWGPIVGFLGLAVIRGTLGLAIKVGTDAVPPASLVSLRLPIALPIWLGMMCLTWRRDAKLRENVKVLKDWKKQLVLMCTGFTINMPSVLFGYALLVVPVAAIGILQASMPLFAVILRYIPPFKNPANMPTKHQISGVVIGIAGVFLILFAAALIEPPASPTSATPQLHAVNSTVAVVPQQHSVEAEGTAQWLVQNARMDYSFLEGGNVKKNWVFRIGFYLLSLVGVILWSINAVFWEKYGKGNFHPLIAGASNTTYGSMFAILVSLLFEISSPPLSSPPFKPNLAWFGDLFPSSAESRPSNFAHLWLAVFFLAVGSNVVSFWLVIYLIGKLGAVAAVQTECLVPVIALLEGVLLFGDWDGAPASLIVCQMCGLVLVVAGLLICNQKPPPAVVAMWDRIWSVLCCANRSNQTLGQPLLDSPDNIIELSQQANQSAEQDSQQNLHSLDHCQSKS